jgi:hypothetical protein
LDPEVLSTLQDDILKPAIVEQAIALALEALRPERQSTTRDALQRVSTAHATRLTRGGRHPARRADRCAH